MLCSALSGAAQSPIRVGKNVLVSQANPKTEYEEVVLCADQNNSGRLLAASNYFHDLSDYHATAVYASSDGGRSWTPVLDTHEHWKESVDPACAYGFDGTAYYSVMADPLARNFWKLYVMRSTDGGHTWDAPVQGPGTQGADRQYMVVDDTSGQYRGRVYMNSVTQTLAPPIGNAEYDILLSRSANRGETFELPARQHNGRLVHNGSSVVLSDGTVAWVYAEFAGVGEGGNEGGPGAWNTLDIKFITSPDGGETLAPPSLVAHAGTGIGQRGVEDFPLTDFICSTAVDRSSSPFHDRIYALWPSVESGRVQAWFAFSSDKGKTWSAPRPIEDNQVFDIQHPEKGPDDINPMVAVNSCGVVGVFWYDRRESADNYSYFPRFRASLDGGETFTSSAKVSDAPKQFDYSIPHWRVSGGGTEKESELKTQIQGGRLVATWDPAVYGYLVKGGDTSGLAADGSGTFHTLWVDNRNGVPQLWTAPIEVTGAVVKYGSPDLAALADLTEKVTVEFASSSFDEATGVATVGMRIKNTSKDVLGGPLNLRVLRFSTGIAYSVIPLNAENHQSGEGAVWDFSSTLPSGHLGPGEISAAKTLQFRLASDATGGHRFPHWVKGLKTSFINLDMEVLGKVEKSSSETP